MVMNNENRALWKPSWTEEVKIESGGRYPLGLNRFHNGLESFLIKGIVYTANRLRYITYYCWAIGDIQESVICKQYSDFVEAFRLRENALALGLYLNKQEYGVVGSVAMRHIVSDNKKAYDCNFPLIQSNKLGGFGLYYVGTIDSFGLIQINEKGIYELSETGKKIYQIHLSKINNTKYFKNFKGKKTVPDEVLLEWGKVNDLNNIAIDINRDEREFYKSLVFRLDQKKSSDFRRESFSYFLECILQCSRSNTCFNENVLRNTHYYSQFYTDKNGIIDFNLPDYFRDSHFYWKIYEGHAYFRFWLTKLFQEFLKYLKSKEEGVTINDFLVRINQNKINEVISHFCQRKEDITNLTLEKIISAIKDPKRMESLYSEESIYRDEQFESLEGTIAKCVLTFINLFLEFKDLRNDKRYQHVDIMLLNDLWFGRLYYDFPNIKKYSLMEFLKIVLGTYIVSQHEDVQLGKNDLRRRWFTYEKYGTEEKFYFQADASLIFRPAKYETIMSFLYDLKLIKNTSNIIELTEEGNQLYSYLKKEYLK